MKKLPFIEDYIDLMSSGTFWPPKPTLIKLARYDQPIVDSMADQINKGTGFTDRQSVLAHKIVTKYSRQWSVAGYDVADHARDPKFKLPIRNIDRRKIIDIVDSQIEIRFPYDQDLISKIRASVSSVPGSLIWKPLKHAWISSLIEPRVIWAKEFGAQNNFDFGEQFNDILKQILTSDEYAIELINEDQGFAITNAESSLQEYVQEHIGFELDKLCKLVDYSSVLGYTVSDSIKQQMIRLHGTTITDLMTNKNTNLTYKDNLTDFENIVKYANLTGRYPICVFETGSRQLLNQVNLHFDNKDIISQGHHLVSQDNMLGAKVVYFTTWKNIKFNMPLFVTQHTFVIGHRRQVVAAQADKVVYYTQIVDTNADL